MRSVFSAALLAVAAAATASAQSTLVWGPAPPSLPAGAKLAVLQGDPSQPGMYTIRLDLPAGYRVAPHFHPSDEYLTVIQGTFLLGMGDKLDVAQARALTAGEFGTVGANMHHFAVAKGRTIVQVHGMGPFVLTYVNPKDAPQPVSAQR